MNVADIVTERIISQLEAGVVPWHKPWKGCEAPVNYITGKRYNGVNLLLLDKAGEWMTFKQCTDKGGKVKKGEKSSKIVFFKMIDKQEENEDKKISYPVMQYSSVFHISQCEGLESKVSKLDESIVADDVCEAIVMQYLTDNGIAFTEATGTDRAFYRPTSDAISIPDKRQFDSIEEYYGTLFHELIHSTGVATRLNRIKDNAAFGSEDYSKEELIAEIGSAMLMSEMNMDAEKVFKNSTAYIAGWLKAIKGNDKHMIISAAAQAQKAVDMILKRKEPADKPQALTP